MDLFNLESIKMVLDLLIIPFFFIVIILLIIIFHILIYLLIDRKRLRGIRVNKDPEKVSIEDLKEHPVVNIIIPAWKEGKEFENLLISITNLSYPNIKAIVNAGGTEETIRIANDFKKYQNFVILKQEGGKDRAALGKISAVNQCLDYVYEGLLFITDADCYLNDEIILRLIYPIVNGSEKVVIGGGTRPLLPQENIGLVKYLQFSTFGFFKAKYTRYHQTLISGASTCLTHDVIKSIGKFEENRVIAEDLSRGQDIISKGYKPYWLNHFGSFIHTDFPKTFKELSDRRKRQIQNTMIHSLNTKNIRKILKNLTMSFLSIYIVFSPILIFIHPSLFIIGVFMLFGFYLIRIRSIIFFKLIVPKEFHPQINGLFYLKIVYFLYLDLIINVKTFFGLYSYKRRLKREQQETSKE